MKKVIAVDFDGTICENRFPEIGEPNTELIGQLIEEQEAALQSAGNALDTGTSPF